MAFTFEEAVKYLEEKFPQDNDPFPIRNCAEIPYERKVKTINQYLIGITTMNPFTNTISDYKDQLTSELSLVSDNVDFVPWTFEADEIEELKDGLEKLLLRYGINTDVDKMIKREYRKDRANRYAIVVTVVQYNIAYID